MQRRLAAPKGHGEESGFGGWKIVICPNVTCLGWLTTPRPARFPLMTALLKSRVDIGAENMSPGANGRPWIYHGARLSIFDFDWPYDVPFAVRQFLE